MKTLLFLLLPLVFPLFLFSQAVSINESGAAPNAKSILDISSITKGLLVPRMTTVQRIAIAPGASEKGLLVFDTDLNKYMCYTGAVWEVVGDGLWLSHAQGAYRFAKVGINAIPDTRSNLYVYGDQHLIGPDTSTLYVFRYGSNLSTQGGTSFNISGIDAGIKSFSYWGNPYSAASAAYSFLDYNQSAALVAGKNDASTLALLGYRDGSGKFWAGQFNGNAKITGQLGIGVDPGSFANLHVETSTYDRTGYFINSKTTAGITYGLYAGAFGTGSGSKRAAAFDATGGTGVNMAIRAFASGGSASWAGYFAAGNVYINDNLAINTETMATGYALSVNGRIISTELRIQNFANWPDYVFESDYPLLSLYELEKRIHEEKHLPGIPSAREVKAEGVLIGEMQRLLVEKIEELTLHTIAQQKQIDKQQEQIETLLNLLSSEMK